MNSLERVSTALKRGQPDRVPVVEAAIHSNVREKISPGVTYAGFIREMDLDMAEAEEIFHNKSIDEKTQLNEWGVVIKDTNEMIWFPVTHPIKNMDDLVHYLPPDPAASYRLDELYPLVSEFKGEKAVFFGMHDVFRVAHDLRGFDQLLMDFLLAPNLAKGLLDVSLEYHVELAKQAIKAGADGILLVDDYAFKTGPFMSPQMFEEFIVPRMTKLVQEIKSAGGFCIKHTDGNITLLMDGIISTGVDCVHPFEPAAGMDLKSAKANWGDRICIMGNVDCGPLMSFGKPEEVEETVKQCIKDAAGGGGYILSSSNSIHSFVKPENFVAMIKAGHKYGIY